MSFINTNSPFGEPLFGFKETFFEENGMQNKHPLHQVDSGLPKSLGDALGDLDPQQLNRAILALIYTMRSLETVKSTAKTWFGRLRAATAKLKNTEKPKENKVDEYFDIQNICGERPRRTDNIQNLSFFNLKRSNQDYSKNMGALKLVANQLIKNYIKDVDLIPDKDVKISDENAHFIGRLQKINLNTHQLRRLPADELDKLRELIDYRFDEYQPGYPCAVARSSRPTLENTHLQGLRW